MVKLSGWPVPSFLENDWKCWEGNPAFLTRVPLYSPEQSIDNFFSVTLHFIFYCPQYLGRLRLKWFVLSAVLPSAMIIHLAITPGCGFFLVHSLLKWPNGISSRIRSHQAHFVVVLVGNWIVAGNNCLSHWLVQKESQGWREAKSSEVLAKRRWHPRILKKWAVLKEGKEQQTN